MPRVISLTVPFVCLQRGHVPKVIKKKPDQSGKMICSWSPRQGSKFLQIKRILSKNKRSDSIKFKITLFFTYKCIMVYKAF